MAANFSIAANQEAEATGVSVKATGVGITQEKALANAITNAIQQVVGQYVQAETIVENNQIIKDEIINYSAGYLERYNILDTHQDEDQLFHVSILGTVQKTRLLEKLSKLNIAIKEIDGASLAASVESQQTQLDQGAKILSGILEKYPDGAFETTINNVETNPASATRKDAIVEIDFSFGFDQNFLKHLKEVLGQVAIKKISSVTYDRFLKLDDNIEAPVATLCFANVATFKPPKVHEEHLSIIDDCYLIDYAIFTEALAKSDLLRFDGTRTKIYFDDQSAHDWTGRYSNQSGEAILFEILGQADQILSRHIAIIKPWGAREYLYKQNPVAWSYVKQEEWIDSQPYWRFLFFPGAKEHRKITFELDSEKLNQATNIRATIMNFR